VGDEIGMEREGGRERIRKRIKRRGEVRGSNKV